jgi:hypothetical protein
MTRHAWDLGLLTVLAAILATLVYIKGGGIVALTILAMPFTAYDMLALKKYTWSEMTWPKKVETVLALLALAFYLFVLPAWVLVTNWAVGYSWIFGLFWFLNLSLVAWSVRQYLTTDLQRLQRELTIALAWMVFATALFALLSGG